MADEGALSADVLTFDPFAVEGYDLRPAVSEVTAPILVVHGDADRMPIEGSLE
jgi:hypothetical protein